MSTSILLDVVKTIHGYVWGKYQINGRYSCFAGCRIRFISNDFTTEMASAGYDGFTYKIRPNSDHARLAMKIVVADYNEHKDTQRDVFDQSMFNLLLDAISTTIAGAVDRKTRINARTSDFRTVHDPPSEECFTISCTPATIYGEWGIKLLYDDHVEKELTS